MSLKLFFNRKGKVVVSLTITAWLGYALQIWMLRPVLSGNWEPHGRFTTIAFLIHLGLAALLTLIRFWPWYKASDRGAGIEEHFEKTMVPVAYILVVTNVLFLIWNNCWPFLLFTHLVFTVILVVNMILLRFHFMDKDTIPPSYFQRNLHLPQAQKN